MDRKGGGRRGGGMERERLQKQLLGFWNDLYMFPRLILRTCKCTR